MITQLMSVQEVAKDGDASLADRTSAGARAVGSKLDETAQYVSFLLLASGAFFLTFLTSLLTAAPRPFVPFSLRRSVNRGLLTHIPFPLVQDAYKEAAKH